MEYSYGNLVRIGHSIYGDLINNKKGIIVGISEDLEGRTLYKIFILETKEDLWFYEDEIREVIRK